MKTSKINKAFTLIELMVVIGLIAVLAAGIGLAMRESNPTAGLRGGQNVLVGLLSSARGQAALNQTEAMIIVDATDSKEDFFLRSLQVVVKAGAGPDTWRPVGAPVLLPQGIYIVPPANFASVTFGGTKSDGFDSSTPASISPADSTYDELSGRKYLRFRKFLPLGTTSGTGRIIVTVGRRAGESTISLDNPKAVRGVTVSRYGVPTLINEAATFANLPQ